MPRAVTTKQYLHEVFFVQSYLQPIWQHTWSLSVEEHFYLLLPMALWAMQRFDRSPDPFRHLLKVFAVAAVACPILRVVATHQRGWSVLMPTMQSHLRVDALLFGVLLCYLRQFRPEMYRQLAQSRAGLVMMAVAAITLLAFHKEDAAMMTFGLTFLYLGFGFLLIRTVDASPPRIARFVVRPLASIGIYSYSIYLWHVVVRLALLRGMGLPNSFLHFAIYLGVSVLLGIGASKLIEIPVLAYRDRYFPDVDRPASLSGVTQSHRGCSAHRDVHRWIAPVTWH